MARELGWAGNEEEEDKSNGEKIVLNLFLIFKVWDISSSLISSSQKKR